MIHSARPPLPLADPDALQPAPGAPATEATRLAPDASVAVAAELERMLTNRTLQAFPYGSEYTALWQHVSACALGGKLVRPRLLLGTYDALVAARKEPHPDSGVATERRAAAIRLAAATELLHYSFLLHDDVIDGDLTRRNRPNLIGAVLESRATAHPQHEDPTPRDLHWAHTSGILMGDLMLSIAHQVIAREALPQNVRIHMLDLLDRTVVESVAGEHLDVGLSDRVISPDLDTVLWMSQLKTATYTFEFPLRAAAILAESSTATISALGEIGRHLGLAFQLQDDLLSTFGNPQEHGKDAFSDLREGKETALIAFARETYAWPEISISFGASDLRMESGIRIRELLRDCGAERAVQQLISDQVAECFARCASDDGAVPAEVAACIEQLVAGLEGRRS